MRRRNKAGAGVAPLDRTRAIEVTPGLSDRLWSKVDRSAGPNACWPFTGKCQSGGYGVQHVGGKPGRTIYAHRLVYRITTGTDPIGKAVCHRCDNPPCCNPAHLFLGTIGDNVRDMVAKGRHRTPHRWAGPVGEQVGGAKLTAEKVREIRRRSASGEGSCALGRVYGMDSSSIRQIVRRVTWRHVD